jgi:hypothetical protein
VTPCDQVWNVLVCNVVTSHEVVVAILIIAVGGRVAMTLASASYYVRAHALEHLSFPKGFPLQMEPPRSSVQTVTVRIIHMRNYPL